MDKVDKIEDARKVFDAEIAALEKVRDGLDGIFIKIVDAITNCGGKVIVSGVGKPGYIARKMSATFASLGTPSLFLDADEAAHGGLGAVSSNDVVMMISYSGESDEIIRIIPNIKMIGATIIALTGNANSTLARYADITQILPEFAEACNIGMAPTASTTAELCYGDALAVVASKVYGFDKAAFGKFHPAGVLGKKLFLTVGDLMAGGEKSAVIDEAASLNEAIVELGRKCLGMVCMVNAAGELSGIITDGDLRRLLAKKTDIYALKAKEVMTRDPIVTQDKALAVDALKLMRERNVVGLPVVKDKRVIGIITLQAIIGAGIVNY